MPTALQNNTPPFGSLSAGVRQVESGVPCLVSCHKSIRKVLIDSRADVFQITGLEIGVVCKKVPHPFRVDAGAP